MSTKEYTNALAALERVGNALREKSGRVQSVLDALNGEAADTPDLLFVYPPERRRDIISSLAADLDLTVDELRILAYAVACSSGGTSQ